VTQANPSVTEQTLEGLSERTRIRLWTLEHFRKLPTEESYLKLTQEQCELLYLSYMVQATPEEVRDEFLRERRREKERDDAEAEMPKEEFEDMGYSEDEINEIIEAVADVRSS
jgi:hypothetical protein